MGKAGIRGDGETEAGEEGCRIGLVKKFAVVRWGWRMLNLDGRDSVCSLSLLFPTVLVSFSLPFPPFLLVGDPLVSRDSLSGRLPLSTTSQASMSSSPVTQSDGGDWSRSFVFDENNFRKTTLSFFFTAFPEPSGDLFVGGADSVVCKVTVLSNGLGKED